MSVSFSQTTPAKIDASFRVALAGFAQRYATRHEPEPVNTGAETDGDDSHDPHTDRPTDEDLNEQFLCVNGWTVTRDRDPRDNIWLDPLTDRPHFFEDALTVQNERDLSGWSFTN